MKTFHILISESWGKTIEVKAKTENQATKKVQRGEWTDKDIVKENIIDWLWVETEEIE